MHIKGAFKAMPNPLLFILAFHLFQNILEKGKTYEGKIFQKHLLQACTGAMAASEIPPQMANFLFSCQDFAHCYFVLNFSLSAQKQHILVLRNTPNCSSVHSGMTGISLAELALHNRCET